MARRSARPRRALRWTVLACAVALAAAWTGFRLTDRTLAPSDAPPVARSIEADARGTASVVAPSAVVAPAAAAPAMVAPGPLAADADAGAIAPAAPQAASGRPSKPAPPRERLSDDDRRALDAVLDRAAERNRSR
ncbi:MAG TPA: hypothetical protein VFD92_13835 [Candidatus Binatia bacterium]|nr:hypothetical protein [Candidatus Binatia bacterium]